MSEPKQPFLTEIKRCEILAILAVGCCRGTAARYVGCHPSTIYRTAGRDPVFAEQLRHAESRTEFEYMKNIQQAARDPRYWRAAAWVLERKNPLDYGLRPADTITYAQVEQLFQHVAEVVAELLPASEHRHVLLKRLDALVQELLGPEAQQVQYDALEETAQ